MKRTKFLIIAGFVVLLQGCVNSELRKESDLQALHREAQAAYDSGDDLKAESAYNTLSVRQPQDAETWLRLGNIYARNKYLDKAIDAYGRSLKINPADARPLNNLSIVHLRKAWIAALAARQASAPEQAAHQISGEIIEVLEGLSYVAEAKTAEKPDPLAGKEKLVLRQATGSASAIDQTILPESAGPIEDADSVDSATAQESASSAAVSQADAEGMPTDIKKIRGLNPANLANSFYVRAYRPAVLITKDLQNTAQAELRIELAAGDNKRIQLLPTEVVRVEQGGRPEIFYQGYRVPKTVLESGAWMQLVPATAKSRQ